MAKKKADEPVEEVAEEAAPDHEKVEVEPGVDEVAPVVDSDDPPGYQTITLAQHWTNPDTGVNVLPGDSVRVTVDQARGLEGAGYVAAAPAEDTGTK